MGGRVRVRTVSGPLTVFAPGFEVWLAARGYAPATVMHRRRLFDHLSRWLELEGLRADELTAERAEQFLRARRAAGYVTWVSMRSVVLPLEYLREVRAVPPPVAVVAEGPLEELLVGYRSYLVRERGLAQSTIAEYERVARLFLGQRPGGLALGELAAADVSGFLVRECPRRSVACDRRRTVGRRDYAILLLLVRLGLRVGEVAAIELGDLDWRRGEILIRAKRNRHDRLPLPVDVGEALVAYLRRRGRHECRALFLKAHAPAGALRGNTVCGVVGDACVRAGVPRVGAHRLRHTAATGMLRQGASLPEIAQVLRHREIKTTAIYAKVDRTRLRALAQPWPGGQS